MNIISSDKLIETERSELVAGYVGQTAIKTKEVIETALGGVLLLMKRIRLLKVEKMILDKKQ